MNATAWNSVPEPSGGGGVATRGADVTGADEGGTVTSGESPDAMMERLVDAVADRLEQRVLEELERRGRRQSWTAF